MMKKWLKWLSISVGVLVILIFAGLGYLYVFHGYHGNFAVNGNPKNHNSTNLHIHDINGNGVSNKREIVSKAKGLVGTLYDPLKGSIDDIGGRMGFIVCIDVPRIAYGNAGIDFKKLLTDDYRKHPEHYNTEHGINTPSTPFFFRRVRNFYDFAKGNGYLIKNAKNPQVGDIVFYSRYHATLVVGTHSDGTYDEVEADPDLIVVKDHHHKKWEPKDVARFLSEKGK